MAFFDSSISRFHIDDTAGASHDLSASITEIQGIPGSRSLTEITSLSDEGRVYIRRRFAPDHRHAYRHLRRLPKRR